MKLSSNTLAILKNCSTINPGIVINGGNKISTLSVMRNVFLNAIIEEELPACAFYNLSEFLSVISMFKEPELEFNDKFVLIGAGKTRVKYVYSDPVGIVAPTKEITPPSMEIKFKISSEVMSEILKGSSILALPDIVVTNAEGLLKIIATDLKNPNANTMGYDIDADELPEDVTFSINFKSELIQKLRAGSYHVGISSRRISSWENQDIKDLQYFVGAETSSKYGVQ